MRLRKLLTATGAVMAAGALTLAPTLAHAAGPIALLEVNGSTADGTVDVDAILKDASVTIPVYGSPTKLNCSSGTASGVINRGTDGVPTNAALSFDQLSLVCDSFLAGTTVTMTLDNCNVDFVADASQTVNATKTDLVTGITYMSDRSNPSTHCVRINVTGGCVVRIGGSVATTYNENKKIVDGIEYSDLHLDGSGLTTNGPNLLCLGAVGNGTPFSIDATFNTNPNINFIP